MMEVTDDWFELAIENSLSVPNRVEIDRQKTAFDLTTPARKIGEDDNLVPFRIAIKSLELLPSSVPTSISTPYEIKFTATLFDSLYRRFYGRTWSSAWHKAKVVSSGTMQVKLEEPLYFYIPMTDDRNSLVLQFICRSGDNSNEGKEISIGWTAIRLKAWTPDDDRTITIAKKNPLYHGSARALMYLKEPIDDSKRLVNIPSAFIFSDIRYHDPLSSYMQYIPGCTIFGRGSSIGGIEPPRTSNEDNLKRPQSFADQRNIFIENLEIDMKPSIAEFESEFCRLINEDRIERRRSMLVGTHNSNNENNVRISIVERRLRVGVHNGYCYVDDPFVLHLTYEQEDSGLSTLSRKLSFRQSIRRRTLSADSRVENAEARKKLYLRNPVRLENVPLDRRTGIVFALEYVVAMPSAMPIRVNEPIETTKSTFTIRWMVWFPGQEKRVELFLRGDDILPCDELFVYKASLSNATNPALKVEEILNFNYRFDSEPPSVYQKSQYKDSIIEPTPQRSLTTNPAISMPPTHIDAYSKISTFPRQVPSTIQPPIYQHTTMSQWEVAQTQPAYSPMSALASQTMFSSALSRASYARFQALGFPTIKSRDDKEAAVIDVNRVRTFESENEMTDPLNCNEIHFHFLAFLKSTNQFRSASKSTSPRSLFFLFKFYRFGQTTTNRVMLERLHDGKNSESNLETYILWRLNENQTKTSGLPGLTVKYQVDGGFLGHTEQMNFFKYLDTHIMYIELWDGDILFPIGVCGVELRNLFRNNQVAIQALIELDIYASLPAESITMPSIENQSYQSTGQGHSLIGERLKSVGKLIMRIGNVGVTGTPYESLETLRKGDVLRMLPSNRIVAGTPTFDIIQERTGEITKTGISTHRLARAKRIVDSNPGLKSTLRAVDQERADSELQRKLARMKAVRDRISDSGDEHSSGSLTMSNQKLRKLRATDLQSISMFRQQTKHDDVIHHLKNSVTRELQINLVPGNVEFFEYVLQNPLNEQVSIVISTNDDELSVVTSSREWRYLQTLYGLAYKVEEDMFTRKDEIIDQNGFKCPQVIMQPKEILNIPFKLQTFLVKNPPLDNKISPSPHAQDHTYSVAEKHFNQRLSEKDVIAEFRSADGIVINRLVIHVKYMLPTISQTIRCINGENTLFKRSFRIPNPRRSITIDSSVTGLPGEFHQVYVKASDQNIVCASEPVAVNEPCHISIKAASQNAPSVNSFLVFLYYDGFMHSPIDVWEFQIHAVKRIDMTCIQFQTTTTTLLLRGKPTSRVVQCFSNIPEEMKISPPNAFSLPANNLQEIHVLIRSERSGIQNYSINVVDIEIHQVIETWLLRVDTRVPNVSKTFVNKIPHGQSQPISKRISYTNPYQTPKSFFFSSSRPDLLQLQHQKLDFQPEEKRFINMTLLPAFDVPNELEIFIFINNDQDANEDVYLIRNNYVHSANYLE